MIKEDNDSISSVYDETTYIGKIMKGVLKVYESWKKLLASGIPPLTLTKCKGVDLIDYKLYGNSVQESDNLFDINTMSERIYAYILSELAWAYAEDSYSIKVPVKPNTTYKVSTDNEVTIFRVACIEHESIPVANNPVGIVKGVLQTNNTPITITTTANTLYLVIQSNNATMEETLKTLKVEQLQPTPEAPIEIESVGDKTNNLFNINAIVSTSYTINGNSVTVTVRDTNSSTSSGSTLQELCPDMVAGKTYRIYYDADMNNSNISTGAYNNTNIWQNRYPKTITETDLSAIVRFGTSGTTTRKVTFSNIQIVEDEIDATEYEPYGYKIPVKVSGKNLLNWGTKEFTTLYYETFENPIPAGTYTFSAFVTSEDIEYNRSRFIVFMEDGSQVGGSLYRDRRDYYTFTANSPITQINIYSSSGSSASMGDKAIFKDIQIEQGTVPTDYEPYVEPITTNIYLNEPLRRIGDYADYIDFENKKVVRNINKYILTGNSSVKTNPTAVTGYQTYQLVITTLNWLGETPVFSSKLPGDKNWTNGYNLKREQISIAAQVLTLRIAESREVEFSSTGIKSWLGENNIDVYFPAKTPIEEDIKLPNIPTIKGTTILEIDTEIQPSNMEVIYKGKD